MSFGFVASVVLQGVVSVVVLQGEIILDLGGKGWPINLIRIGSSLYVELVELDPKDDLELELEPELELVGVGMCIADSW